MPRNIYSLICKNMDLEKHKCVTLKNQESFKFHVYDEYYTVNKTSFS